ncbi:MAG: hypothetical protein PHE24_05630 [Patescibacteria group bacterium]|nr:hypothetical protein [Patescibacteria group bacterium]
MLQTGAIKDYANFLSGTVLSVAGNEVSFSAPLVNPLQDENLKTRVAVVTADTKIYVYKLRSQAERDQAAKDSAAEIKKLQDDLAAVDAAFKNCGVKANPAGCADEQKNRQDIQAQIFQLRSLSDQYAKAEGTLADIKSGWLITAVAGKAANQTDNVSVEQRGVNIASAPKFEAASIEVREVMPKPTEK